MVSISFSRNNVIRPSAQPPKSRQSEQAQACKQGTCHQRTPKPGAKKKRQTFDQAHKQEGRLQN